MPDKQRSHNDFDSVTDKAGGTKIAIVTGVSSGVGIEFLKQIDQRYPYLDELWLLARREGRMEAVAKELRTTTRIFALDLTQQPDLDSFWDHLSEVKPNINLLVNNAGYGKQGRFSEIDEETQLNLMDLNMRSVVQMTKRCLPFMQADARIINVSSVAAFMPQPGFSIYAASKAFVLNFSRALNAELKDKDISVLAACPNPMETEFFDIAGESGSKRSLKKAGLEPVDKMVKIALDKSDRRKDFSTSCVQAKVIHVISRILPHRFIFWAEKKIGFY